MGKGMTFFIKSETISECIEYIDRGEFDNFSSMVNYAIRFFYDFLIDTQITSIPHIARDGALEKKNVVVNEFVVQNILNSHLMCRSEIADYALQFYLTFKNKNK